MLEELFEYLKPQQESVTLGGKTLIVKELTGEIDRSFATSGGGDMDWKIMVRCVFLEDGKPAFSEDDIPKLKASGSSRIAPLLKAMYRVNGLDTEAEAKK